MTWSSTLAELRTEVRDRGDYNNSAVFTSAFLTRAVNTAIAHVHAWIAKEDPSYFATETTLSTSAGVATVALPATYFKALRLDLQISTGNHVRLRRFTMSEENRLSDPLWVDGYTQAYRWMRRGANIVLRPTPQVVDTLRLLYIPHATKLVSDGDTYDGVNGFEELVVEYGLLICDKREERPIQERLREIERLKEDLRSHIASDESEPDLLGDFGEGTW